MKTIRPDFRILYLFAVSLVVGVLAAGSVSAAQHKSSIVVIPKGSVAEPVTGGFSIRSNGVITGSYHCYCSGDRGTCGTTQTSDGVLTCGKAGDTCNGTCKMDSTTNGGGKLQTIQ